MKQIKIVKPTWVTEDDPETLDDMYEQARIAHLPGCLQRIAVNHTIDQWQAAPTVVERNAQELRRGSLRR